MVSWLASMNDHVMVFNTWPLHVSFLCWGVTISDLVPSLSLSGRQCSSSHRYACNDSGFSLDLIALRPPSPFAVLKVSHLISPTSLLPSSLKTSKAPTSIALISDMRHPSWVARRVVAAPIPMRWSTLSSSSARRQAETRWIRYASSIAGVPSECHSVRARDLRSCTILLLRSGSFGTRKNVSLNSRNNSKPAMNFIWCPAL